MPTPAFLPGQCHAQRSLAGHSPWGCRESDTAEPGHKHCWAGAAAGTRGEFTTEQSIRRTEGETRYLGSPRALEERASQGHSAGRSAPRGRVGRGRRSVPSESQHAHGRFRLPLLPGGRRATIYKLFLKLEASLYITHRTSFTSICLHGRWRRS